MRSKTEIPKRPNKTALKRDSFTFIVIEYNGTLNGPFKTPAAAIEWAELHYQGNPAWVLRKVRKLWK